MDQAHSHTHDHGHDHDHGHHHDHDHHHDHHHDENLSELELKKKRWSAVDRFKSRKGRAPTKDELQQLLEHGHTHDHMENAGAFHSRDQRMKDRDFSQRSFTVGIGGPVGSGKTALMLALCRALRDEVSIAAVTNDIFTREDGEFLVNNEALPAERILAIETGGCPHAAIREDISANLQACEELTQKFKTDLVLIESGGDNLAANYSRELADYIIYVIDVAGGDKVPRKGGPGITQADLLIVNKIDLADAVGADLAVMKHDAALMRSGGPTVFTQVKKNDGKNDSVDEIVKHILQALQDAKSADVSVDVSTSSNKHARIS